MAHDPWRPTNIVPEGGLPTWVAPSPDAAQQEPLGAWLEVMVLERQGDWARVRCENGWETWLDGSRLQPRRSGAPRGVWIAAAAVLAVAALVVAMQSGGSDTKVTSGDHGIKLDVPAGWAVSTDGLTAAASATDLTAAVPSGPRVRAIVSRAGDAVPENRLSADALPGDLRTPVPVGDPERTTVDGRKAVAISLKETEDGTVLRRRYVASKNANGTGVLFILEAPDAVYDTHAKTLESVPGWA